MTAFRSRWLEWDRPVSHRDGAGKEGVAEPETLLNQTDKTDKSPLNPPSVSSVSAKPERFQRETKDPTPDEWNEGVSRLISQPCPHDFLPARWRTLQADAARFLEMWAAQAARLGWTVHDLFGVNQVKPLVRLDGAGLVWLLDGRPVIALTADEAVIECRTGSRQAYRRKPANAVSKVERAPLWEINDG